MDLDKWKSNLFQQKTHIVDEFWQFLVTYGEA